MGRTLTAPTGIRYSGTVELHDPLTYPQYIAWSEAVEQAATHRTESYMLYCQALLPGVCGCVAQWNLTDNVAGVPLGQVTPATFPATPRKSADKLLGWLVDGIMALVAEADEADPK